MDPKEIPTKVELRISKDIGVKFELTGWLSWVVAIGVLLLVAFAGYAALAPKAEGGTAAPSGLWIAVGVGALILAGLFGSLFGSQMELSDSQLQQLQNSPQLKSALVELVDVKLERDRLRDRVIALEKELAVAKTQVNREPVQGIRSTSYDLMSLLLGASLAFALYAFKLIGMAEQRGRWSKLLENIREAINGQATEKTEAGPQQEASAATRLAVVKGLLKTPP